MISSIPTHKGGIRIGVVNSNCGPDYWTLEVNDDNGVRVLDVEIPLIDYAHLLAGREIKVDYQIPGAHLAGMRREVKTEFVPGTSNHTTKRADEARWVGPFEVNGWSARGSDFGNAHHSKTIDGIKGYNVVFIRFVDPLSGNPVDNTTGRML